MNKTTIKTIVIDDEPDIREVLIDTINESLEMEVIGEADSLKSAYELILNTLPDAIFLDIKLKGGDAFQLLTALKRQLKDLPPIILNTGYDDFEFAQRSLNDFGDDIIMILKKPFWENWNAKENEIIKRIRQKQSKPSVSLTSEVIKIKSEFTTYLIRVENLILLEVNPDAKGRGKVSLYTKDKQFSLYKSLNLFEEELNSKFIRVSRYAIINIDYFASYNHKEQTLYLREIPDRYISVGNSYKDNLLSYLEQIE